MDVGTLLFALILLSAGIWLIYNVSGDFKEKGRQGQRFADVPYRKPHVANRSTPGACNSLERVSHTYPSAPKIDAQKASAVRLERLITADPLQSFSESFVREKFERFQREL
jgi:hypothetical protein